MEKVCACIPEMPKIIDGDLYAYVDILDTKNGRLLKTLCDYGFVPGISSRGSGDVDINDEVDPETFYLETFDIVALPAVKKARLTMCEQLDEKSMKLKKALTESLNAASDEDREIMKEALNNLNININEELNLDDIPERPKYIDELEASAKLNEAAEEAEDEEVKETPAEEAEETPEESEKPEEAEKEAAEAAKIHAKYLQYLDGTATQYMHTSGVLNETVDNTSAWEKSKSAIADLAKEMYEASLTGDETADELAKKQQKIEEAFVKSYESIRDKIKGSLDLMKTFDLQT